MRTTTTTFPVLRQSATKSGSCPACGKKVRRSITFEQTVNPYNRNEDGTPKSPSEIRQSLLREVANWTPDFTHERCR